jgi:hypothetical protein
LFGQKAGLHGKEANTAKLNKSFLPAIPLFLENYGVDGGCFIYF